jgi:hypothetical protein
MTSSAMEQIVKAAEACGLDITAYEGYSGRGMFGDTTYGVVVKSVADLITAACEATRAIDDPDGFIGDLIEVKTDSLGRDMIVY